MKQFTFGSGSIRALLCILVALLVTACGGGGSVPYTGVEIRPLSQDFTTRRAVAYSPYRTSTGPQDLAGEDIPKANIRQDLDLLLAAGFRLIRLFDSSDKVARQTLEVIRDQQLNIKVQLGAYVVGGDEAGNRAELARCVALAQAFEDIVLAVSVGNETMVSWSGHKVETSVMADYIQSVRSQITQPVTTDDNYAFWASVPTEITDVIDFVALHTYAELDTVYDPTRWDWRRTDVPPEQRAVAMMDAAIAETRRQYEEARAYLDRKGLSYIPIIVGETGWNAVDRLGRLQFRAHPVNQKMYLDRLTAWAAEGRAGAGPKQVFYFEAFDEPWKQADDGWGLFNKDRQARYAVQHLNADGASVGTATWVWEPGVCSDANAVSFVEPVVNDVITQDRYTLYSEAAPLVSEFVPTGLRWDAFDGYTAAYPEVTTAYGPGDATHSIEITPNPAAYGWGLLLHPAATGPIDSCTNLPEPLNGASDNLSAYAATGTLNFSIQTTYPGKIEIGIATDTQDREPQEAFLQIEPGNYGYCNTGAWCSVAIPLADFVAVNPRLDLSLVLSRFVIADRYAFTDKPDAAAGAGSTTKLYLDGIYWSK
jgi:exo-beta-1,3-glucanase (GH17 family)